ncbi:hypothetical protein LCGC14_2281730 [marine sediment metagenome]|uniref:Uncharacterized protein n=1 Tax=marine sediment metagenome TaxID=412755 RepID=A0A0F9DGA9_9ZZZZ
MDPSATLRRPPVPAATTRLVLKKRVQAALDEFSERISRDADELASFLSEAWRDWENRAE